MARRRRQPVKAMVPAGFDFPNAKAAFGTGAVKLQYEPPLSSFRQTPQEMMKRFLKAYRVGWFYKAESVIAFDVSTTETVLKREDGTEVERPNRLIPFDQLNPIEQCARLLDMPNPQQTWRQFIEKTQIRADMTGNAFFYLDAIDEQYGTPSAMYGISPHRMWPSHKGNRLIGWIMDYDERGGGTPFRADEIFHLAYGSADEDVFGVGVVESVLAEWENSRLLSQHISDVLTLGGRLAGMISPKERSLTEDEFQDTLRAWRAMANGGDAGRRLLVFPEPVEWTRGSATPQEIGLPGLNEITRANILTAFPVGEVRLQIPVEAGLNSGDTRKHMFREHYEFTIHPRLAVLQEAIQHRIIDKFSERAGEELTFEFKERIDDAPTILEKAAAFRALLNLGFDPESIIGFVGLDKVIWSPELLQSMIEAAFLGATEAAGQEGGVQGVPGLGAGSHVNRQKQTGTQSTAQQQRNNARNTQAQKNALTGKRIPNPLLAGDVGQRIFINDSNRKDNVTVSQQLTTQRKAARMGPGRDALPAIEKNAKRVLSSFFDEQRERIVNRIKDKWPRTKAARKDFDEPEWWDEVEESEELQQALQEFIETASIAGLQQAANQLERFIDDTAVNGAIDQTLALSIQDINLINQNTKDSIRNVLQTAARRGYSINQIVEGVPDENFVGLQDVLLDNGYAMWGDARAEMIARTELMSAYNRANLLGYGALGVTYVEAKDGDDFDVKCRERNGNRYSIADALREREHPNGTLDWIPLPREVGI